MQRAPKSTRVFVGKLGTLTKQDLFKECTVHGNIVDFLMKEQYAFVVSSSHPNGVGIRDSRRGGKGHHRPGRQVPVWNENYCGIR